MIMICILPVRVKEQSKSLLRRAGSQEDGQVGVNDDNTDSSQNGRWSQKMTNVVETVTHCPGCSAPGFTPFRPFTPLMEFPPFIEFAPFPPFTEFPPFMEFPPFPPFWLVHGGTSVNTTLHITTQQLNISHGILIVNGIEGVKSNPMKGIVVKMEVFPMNFFNQCKDSQLSKFNFYPMKSWCVSGMKKISLKLTQISFYIHFLMMRNFLSSSTLPSDSYIWLNINS